MSYTSKYKISQSVLFLNQSAEIVGIRYTLSTIRYDLIIRGMFGIDDVHTDLIEGEGIQSVWDSHIPYHLNHDIYYIIMGDIIIPDCTLRGVEIFEKTDNSLDFRYTVGYNKTKSIMSSINPSLIFTEADALVKIRERKIKYLIGEN